MFSAVSVCLSVCLVVRTITSERLNIGCWNLAVRCNVQKSRPSSNLGVKGERSRSPGTKKTKKCGISWGTVLCGARRGRGYSGGKISARCLVFETAPLPYNTGASLPLHVSWSLDGEPATNWLILLVCVCKVFCVSWFSCAVCVQHEWMRRVSHAHTHSFHKGITFNPKLAVFELCFNISSLPLHTFVLRTAQEFS